MQDDNFVAGRIIGRAKSVGVILRRPASVVLGRILEPVRSGQQRNQWHLLVEDVFHLVNQRLLLVGISSLHILLQQAIELRIVVVTPVLATASSSIVGAKQMVIVLVERRRTTEEAGDHRREA